MNVALLVLDSVRKDVFDEHATRLQEMAAVDLADCRAVSSWSVPSHAGMVTGRLPSDVGIHSHQMAYDHVAREETIFDLDHRRIGVSSNMYANTHYGFDAFFDSFASLHATNPRPEGIHMGEWLNENPGGPGRYLRFLRDVAGHDHPLASLKNAFNTKAEDVFESLPLSRPTDEGTAAINRTILQETRRADEAGQRDEGDTEPWFVFANYMEAHTPHRPVRGYDSSLYDAPARWSSFDVDTAELTRRRRAGEPLTDDQQTDVEHFRDLYAASVDYLDRKIAATVERLREESDEETMVIVTADHGENLFLAEDEEVWGHTASMSEGLLHVPFLLIGGPEWLRTDPPDCFTHLDLPALVESVIEGRQEWPTRERIPAELVGGGVDIPDTDREYFDRAIRAVYDDPDTKWEWDSLGTRKYHLRDAAGDWSHEVLNDSVEDRDDPEGRVDDLAEDQDDGNGRWDDSVEEWDDSVETLFEEDIVTMKAHAREAAESVELTDAARSRLEELGYV